MNQLPIYIHALTKEDRWEAAAPRIVGDGRGAIWAGTELLSGRKGDADLQPAIGDLEAAIRTIPREATVAFAQAKSSLVQGLILVGQRVVVDGTALFGSDLVLERPSEAQGGARALICAALTTDLIRFRYMLYALTEVEINGRLPADHRQLYCYERAQWWSPCSRYYVGPALKRLGLSGVTTGCFLPPGSLARLSRLPPLSDSLRAWQASQRSMQDAHAELRIFAWRHRRAEIEAVQKVSETVHVLCIRDNPEQLIVEQMVAFELFVGSLVALKRKSWTLRDVCEAVKDCCGPTRLFCFRGMLPLMLQQALNERVKFVDVAVSGVYLDALIDDIALLDASLSVISASGSNAAVTELNRAAFWADGGVGALDEVMCLAGQAPSASSRSNVEQAMRATSMSALIKLEAELRHPLISDEIAPVSLSGIRGSFFTQDAQSVRVTQIRETVSAALRPHSSYIASRLRLLTKLPPSYSHEAAPREGLETFAKHA